MNSLPSDTVLLSLQAAGLRDLVAEADLKPGFTYPCYNPSQRIDYILASPDIGLRTLEVPPDIVSDHLGIGATIFLK